VRENPARQRSGRRRGNRRTSQRDAALAYAVRRGWRVVPGVGLRADGRCRCDGRHCPTAGVHPDVPELLAATTDARMVHWWWTARPAAPLVLATGTPAPCALSLPTAAGHRALAALDQLGVRTGPVLGSPARMALLVAPYELAELGETLCSLLDAPATDGHGPARLPGALRFHGEGGYLPLPPSWAPSGRVRWLRAPEPGDGAPWLPEAAGVLRALAGPLGRARR
jgi:hypothetical protein